MEQFYFTPIDYTMSISCGQNFTVTIDDSGCVWWFGAVRNNDSLPTCTRIPVELNTNGVKIKMMCHQLTTSQLV